MHSHRCGWPSRLSYSRGGVCAILSQQLGSHRLLGLYRSKSTSCRFQMSHQFRFPGIRWYLCTIRYMGLDTTLWTTKPTIIYVFYGYFNSNKVTSNFETESELFFFLFTQMYVKRITLLKQCTINKFLSITQSINHNITPYQMHR